MKLPAYNIVLKIFILFFLTFSFKQAFADHLKGGWMKYKFISSSGISSTYEITFYQYSACDQPEKIDQSVGISVFDAISNARIKDIPNVPLDQLTKEQKSDFGPCFQNPPDVCYLIAKYVTVVTLNNNPNGFIIAAQRCCRIEGIQNVPGSNDVGLTYTVAIPGSNTGFTEDSSPQFDADATNSADAVAICFSSPFTLDFGAKDPDGDLLVYSFCSGLSGASKLDPKPFVPPQPPYDTIPYTLPYSGIAPMGDSVKIDSKTGIISGIAPAVLGTYVIAVCVKSYRNGKLVSTTRKEIHVDVADCRLGAASLKPTYITCDGYSFHFKNEAPVTPQYTFKWDFGVSEVAGDTSTLPTPVYTYSDTGVYNVKLKISNGLGCADSAFTALSIFPGFTADFSVDGSCIFNPYKFIDKTTTSYGKVNSWLWDFGDATVYNDTSSLQNPPAYTYVDTGIKQVTLYASNSKGCIDTVVQEIPVTYGPQLDMKFRDTLICNIDTLQLMSRSTTSGAAFRWTPAYNISGENTSSPFVSPDQTTLYKLQLTYKGCVTNDSVLVNVTDKVNLKMDNDTLICATDVLQLTPETNALYFKWTPVANISNPIVKEPVVTPLSNTTYQLFASIGKCNASGATNIAVAPYPAVNAGPDQQICYAAEASINGETNGEKFFWSPAGTLIDGQSLTPLAGPAGTTQYILTAIDTSAGKCPKPANDTITITVLPKVQAFAGNDTTVVINEPLQLNATGGDSYQWSPSTFLSKTNISNPVATFTGNIDTILYRVRAVTEEGCVGYDEIVVHAFETVPEIFIPTAFTPNNDGRNDMLKPTVAGMKQLRAFSVYNRWGQQLFITSKIGEGWDGTFNNQKQPSGTYVFAAYAIDFNGKPYEKKGTFVLIR